MVRETHFKVIWLNSIGDVVTDREVSKTTWYKYTKKKNAHIRHLGSFFEIIHICEIYE